MRSFSLFFLLLRAHVCVSACLLCIHIYVPVLCANLEPIIIIDVVGGLFLLHSGNEEFSRSTTRGTTEASALFLSCRDFVSLTTRTNRYDVWETKR